MSVCMVYMTAANEEEAEKIGRTLVEQRLAACVNILPGMRSMYWWDGGVQSGSEVVVLAKTRTDLVDALTSAVKRVHSYDVPCVVSLPLEGGNPDFLNWIYDETKRA